MSEVVENNEDLNEMVEEEVDDADVITVPIDDTLTHSGEAADAKTVGDALALKADKSEVQANITVDGQSKDNTGNIVVKAEHIPYSTGTGAQTVKEKIDEIDEKTAADIPMSTGENPQTVAEAIENAGAKTADMIPMEDGSIETIADRIGDIEDAVDAVEGDVSDLQMDTVELTDAQIHAIVDEVFDEDGDD